MLHLQQVFTCSLKKKQQNRTYIMRLKDAFVIGCVFFIMGRDPVELAKRAKYKPPAMRVRGVCYTKKSPFRYNEVVQAKQIAKGR